MNFLKFSHPNYCTFINNISQRLNFLSCNIRANVSTDVYSTSPLPHHPPPSHRYEPSCTQHVARHFLSTCNCATPPPRDQLTPHPPATDSLIFPVQRTHLLSACNEHTKSLPALLFSWNQPTLTPRNQFPPVQRNHFLSVSAGTHLIPVCSTAITFRLCVNPLTVRQPTS